MPDSPTVALFRSAIGPVNREYYLPILTRFESLGRVGLSWSWAAGLYTLNWMVYRQLWRQAAIYLAALICVLAAAAIIQLVAQPSLPMQVAGVLVLLGLAVGIPGLLGNAWLYADIRNRMTQAIATSKTMAEAGLVLSQQASTRQGFIRQLIANAAIVGVVGVGYLLMSVSEKVSVSETKPVKTVTQVVTPPALTARTLPAPTASSVALVASAPIPPTVATPAASMTARAPVPLLALPAASAPVMMTEPPVPTAPAEAPGATAPPTPKTKPKSHATLVDSSKSSPKKQETPEPVIEKKSKARMSSPDSDAAPRIAYFVNVGLFSKEQNASAAVSQLIAAGMTGTTQRMDVGSKKLTRVRSGPYETQADATEVAVKIRLLNLEAKVFAQKQP
jgi:cell division protein FtsN